MLLRPHLPSVKLNNAQSRKAVNTQPHASASSEPTSISSPNSYSWSCGTGRHGSHDPSCRNTGSSRAGANQALDNTVVRDAREEIGVPVTTPVGHAGDTSTSIGTGVEAKSGTSRGWVTEGKVVLDSSQMGLGSASEADLTGGEMKSWVRGAIHVEEVSGIPCVGRSCRCSHRRPGWFCSSFSEPQWQCDHQVA